MIYVLNLRFIVISRRYERIKFYVRYESMLQVLKRGVGIERTSQYKLCNAICDIPFIPLVRLAQC